MEIYAAHADLDRPLLDAFPLKPGQFRSTDHELLVEASEGEGERVLDVRHSMQHREIAWYPDGSAAFVQIARQSGFSETSGRKLLRFVRRDRQDEPLPEPDLPRSKDVGRALGLYALDPDGYEFAWRPEHVEPVWMGADLRLHETWGWFWSTARGRGPWASVLVYDFLGTNSISVRVRVSNMQPPGQKLGTLLFAELGLRAHPLVRLEVWDGWEAGYAEVGRQHVVFMRAEDRARPYFLPEAASLVCRLQIRLYEEFSDHGEAMRQRPHPMRPTAAWLDAVHGWQEADGVVGTRPAGHRTPDLAPYDDEAWAGFPGGDDYRVRRPIARYRHLWTHQGGAPRRRSSRDVAQLREGSLDHFWDALRIADSDLEGPVQHDYPSLEGGRPIAWRWSPDHPIIGGDRYESGSPNMRNRVTPRPNNDYKSMSVAKDLRTYHDQRGLSKPLTGWDHEHGDAGGCSQAYLRTADPAFLRYLRGRYYCGLTEPTFAAARPIHSERSAAWGIQIPRLLARVEPDPVLRRAVHERAVKVWLRAAEDAGNYRAADGTWHPIDVDGVWLRAILSHGDADGETGCAPWMGGLLIQQAVVLLREEARWQAAGYPVVADVAEAWTVIRDTLELYRRKAWVRRPSGGFGFLYKISPERDWAPYESSEVACNSSRPWLLGALGAVATWVPRDWIPDDLAAWMREAGDCLLAGSDGDPPKQTAWANIWKSSFRASRGRL